MIIAYKTTNLLNNKFYIGIHCCHEDCWHINSCTLQCEYKGSGVKLRRDMYKDGVHNFKRITLKTFENIEDAYLYERELVTKDLVNDPMCYNLTIGGCGRTHGLKYYQKVTKSNH